MMRVRYYYTKYFIFIEYGDKYFKYSIARKELNPAFKTNVPNPLKPSWINYKGSTKNIKKVIDNIVSDVMKRKEHREKMDYDRAISQLNSSNEVVVLDGINLLISLGKSNEALVWARKPTPLRVFLFNKFGGYSVNLTADGRSLLFHLKGVKNAVLPNRLYDFIYS